MKHGLYRFSLRTHLALFNVNKKLVIGVGHVENFLDALCPERENDTRKSVLYTHFTAFSDNHHVDRTEP
jgi:hypothetical protein